MTEREYDDDRPHPDDGKALPNLTVGAVLEHKAKKKPYPGAGAWVVLLCYGADHWVVYRGANTEQKAHERRRELPQWPDERVRVVENVAS
jgi:hypothetical protein